MNSIYMDNASTTKPVVGVISAITPYIEMKWHNPSSLYSKGIKVKDDIDTVRCLVANELHVEPDEIYFTSGASESNSWVIQGFVKRALKDGCKPVVVTSRIEHHSILGCVQDMKECGLCEAIYIATDDKGVLDLGMYETVLNKLVERIDKGEPLQVLVTIQMANNVIGTIQPIERLINAAKDRGFYFHTDATQVFGHLPINMEDLDVDFLSASGQKLHGLKGTGFLYKRTNVRLEPIIHGTQENGLRGGTENVVGIIALGEAIKDIDYSKANEVARVRDYIINQIENTFLCKINGDRYNRLPNNVNVTLKELGSSESLIYALDLSDIYISSGSACESRTLMADHVLKAIGKSIEDSHKTLRITIGEDTTIEKADTLINEMVKQMGII